jgi:hypothetical protein
LATACPDLVATPATHRLHYIPPVLPRRHPSWVSLNRTRTAPHRIPQCRRPAHRADRDAGHGQANQRTPSICPERRGAAVHEHDDAALVSARRSRCRRRVPSGQVCTIWQEPGAQLRAPGVALTISPDGRSRRSWPSRGTVAGEPSLAGVDQRRPAGPGTFPVRLVGGCSCTRSAFVGRRCLTWAVVGDRSGDHPCRVMCAPPWRRKYEHQKRREDMGGPSGSCRV